MTDLSLFGKWLSDQMAREGYNVVGLAKLVGVSHVTIGKWMHGKTTPRASNVRKLAQVFRIDPVDVYRALIGAAGDSRRWPEDVQALVEDYVSLPPRTRRAFRNMVREARGLAKAGEEETVPVGEAEPGP